MNPTSAVSERVSNALGENLLRFRPKQKFMLFDFETCNLNLISTKNVPWEVAWIICDQKEIFEEREYLVNWPEIPIGVEAARVTGYYSKVHRFPLEGKEPEFVFSEFRERLEDPDIIPVAHNGLGFDIYIWQIVCKLLGWKVDFNFIRKFLDTNLVARAKKLGLTFPDSGKDLPSFQFRVYSNPVRGVKTNIRQLSMDYSIPYDETKAHAALYDVKDLLYPILLRLLHEAEIPNPLC